MKAIVYWSKSSGLANRLRALAGYQALSHYLEAPFYLCWVPDPTCDSDFAQLFDTSEIRLITPKQKNSMEGNQEAQVYHASNCFSDIWRSHATDVVSWEEFRRQAVSFLKQLRPVPRITEKVEAFSKRHDLRNASAVHIRLTDNVQAYKDWVKSEHFNPEHISRLEGFEQFIRDSLKGRPDSKVFLATDNEQVEEHVHRAFQGHIISYSKEYRKGFRWAFSLRKLKSYRQIQRTSSIEDALVEFLLLSRCRIIAGTYWSSYGQISSLLGDTDFVVVHGSQYARDRILAKLKGEFPLEASIADSEIGADQVYAPKMLTPRWENQVIIYEGPDS
jgi:hypothetical protein